LKDFSQFILQSRNKKTTSDNLGQYVVDPTKIDISLKIALNFLIYYRKTTRLGECLPAHLTVNTLTVG